MVISPNKLRQFRAECDRETAGTRIFSAAASVASRRMPHLKDPADADLGRLPDKLRRFFLSRGVRTEDDAKDLAQETLLRVFQRMTRGEILDSLEAYSLGVAKNVFLEYCRRIARTSLHDSISGAVQIAGQEDPFSDALVSSRAFRFRRALDLLPARMKSLLVRRFVEEIPSRAIAREEGISTDAVDMRVYRAKRELRKRMVVEADAKPPDPQDDGEPKP